MRDRRPGRTVHGGVVARRLPGVRAAESHGTCNSTRLDSGAARAAEAAAVPSPWGSRLAQSRRMDAMVRARAWTYDGTGLAWLQERLGRSGTGPGHVVSELVPSGFEAYLRIFHRFEAVDGSGRTRRWQTWAVEGGIAFHSELSHLSLPDVHGAAGERVWQTEEGALDGRSRGALARLLMRHDRRPGRLLRL